MSAGTHGERFYFAALVFKANTLRGLRRNASSRAWFAAVTSPFFR